MTASDAHVVRFPGRVAQTVWLVRSRDDPGCWLVLAGEHAWLHGARADASANATWLANNLGMPRREAAS
jgi:hypothetical protein